MTKSCTECGQSKQLDDFYTGKNGKPGSKCKECVKARVRKHREENIENITIYEKKRANLPHRVKARQEYQKTERGKASVARAKKKWQEQNLERRAAHIILGNRLRDGQIVKPESCEICGKKTRINGHHDDYSRPLEVKWVCGKCHKDIHAELKRNPQ